jgi:hypothetical protein
MAVVISEEGDPTDGQEVIDFAAKRAVRNQQVLHNGSAIDLNHLL